MSKMNMSSKVAARRAVLVMSTIGLICSGASATMAQTAPSPNIRGSVVAYGGKALKVKTREGRLVDVALADGWKLASVARAPITSIKAGDYVGIASVQEAGGDRALEVLVFPPALKGLGEGSHGYDLRPNSSMTNASVTNLVEGVRGHTISLSYGGGQQKTIAIPANAPIVTLAPATPDDLKPGAAVFILPDPAGSGVPSTHQVVVGKNGVVPPM